MQNKDSESAKLFSPFDALKGFTEALKLQEKKVYSKNVLNEDYEIIINEKILALKKGDKIKVSHYYITEYITACGIVQKLDYIEKYMILENTKIYFEDILEIIEIS